MKADAQTEAAVRNVLDRLAQSYAQRDWEVLRAILAPDPDVLMYGTQADEKRIGLGEIKAQAERDWSQSESGSIEYDWTMVSAAGDVAWVAADVLFRATIEGQDLALPGRLTAVLEKRGDQWLIAQSHFSFPAPGPEGESFPGSS
jgi:ketosteroid isomerase-like protein